MAPVSDWLCTRASASRSSARCSPPACSLLNARLSGRSTARRPARVALSLCAIRWSGVLRQRRKARCRGPSVARSTRRCAIDAAATETAVHLDTARCSAEEHSAAMLRAISRRLEHSTFHVLSPRASARPRGDRRLKAPCMVVARALRSAAPSTHVAKQRSAFRCSRAATCRRARPYLRR
eukprot:4242539-Prymnesium_polylepis.2